MMREDTIAAIATPLGAGAVGIVRLSGARAVEIADGIVRPSGTQPLREAPSHQVLHGWVQADGRDVDEVMALVMRAPRSYTREDVVELHCHGSTLALRTVLELCCAGGARLAEPGEFTMRAFFNGRIDLTRAEAVRDLIGARSRLGLEASANQLRGRLYEEIAALRESVAQVAALVAAGIDFPEEDVVFAHEADIRARLQDAQARVAALVQGAGRGRVLREGLAVAIVGRPNVGKSSLLNALLRENRAIVTEVPGTTRDTLEELADIGGLTVRLVDTAGIRETADRVEAEGIARSRRAIALADLVLLVLDASEVLTPADEALLAAVPPRASLLVLNKVDRLPGGGPDAGPDEGLPHWAARLRAQEPPRELLRTSAATGAGLAALEAALRRWALDDERPHVEGALLTNLRQEQAAGLALEALRGALAGLDERRGEELLAVDLSRALDALGDIVGETTADDLLNRIFAEFCIGK